MAQEIEYRLERSFQEEESLGGARTAALLRALAASAIDENGERHWLDDFAMFNAVMARWQSLLKERTPPAPDEAKAERSRALLTFMRQRMDQRLGSFTDIAGLIAHDMTLPADVRDDATKFIAECAAKEDAP